MVVYEYTAVDPANRQITATLAADTALEARQKLRQRGLRIVEFGAARIGSSGLRLGPGSKARRREQVAELARYLSLLLRGGVPLAEGLEVLTRQREDKLVTTLKDIRERITAGESLADALAEHGQWFDALFVSAVRVGELSGNLDESLSQLAEHLQTQEKLRGKLTSAMTYPTILACLGIGVVLFLMSFVIPQLLSVLAAAGRPLPASTMLLKRASDLLVNHWFILITGGALIVTAAVSAYRSEAGRRWWHRTQLGIPLLGPLIQKSVVAQFAQQMALLLRTGIPFVEAARSVASLAHNVVLADELNTMARDVESGSDIAPTMSDSQVFPPVVAHLVAVGQDSGELTEMLGELKERYQTEVELALARFTAALEPLLIVLLAAAVGFVVFACLMPILEATRGIA